MKEIRKEVFRLAERYETEAAALYKPVSGFNGNHQISQGYELESWAMYLEQRHSTKRILKLFKLAQYFEQ